jgi:flagellar basal-body rod modification protein FlgD
MSAAIGNSDALRAAAEYAPPVGSTSISDPSGAQQTGRVPVRNLGQNEFFQLLAAQYTYQDPLNPQKDTDFIAQMAQFSSLEQTRLMQSDISELRGQFRSSQANLLLGQWVTIADSRTDREVQGLVTAVTFNNGRPQLVVGDRSYDFDRVRETRYPGPSVAEGQTIPPGVQIPYVARQPEAGPSPNP